MNDMHDGEISRNLCLMAQFGSLLEFKLYAEELGNETFVRCLHLPDAYYESISTHIS